jgi:hypothetical protein
MPQNVLCTRSVAVVLGLVILAATPRQADATDDPRNVSFEERWQTVPRYSEFICGGFRPEINDSSLEKNETSSDSEPPLPRGLRQQLHDVENARLSRDLAKARKKRGTVVIEDPAEGIFGARPEPYVKPCIIGLDQCLDK